MNFVACKLLIYFIISNLQIKHFYVFLAKSLIEPSGVDTAALFLFFDKLFDSLNSSYQKVVEGKIYRSAVTKNSIHHQLWSDSIKIIKSMNFIGKNGKVVNVPTLKNWIITIRGKIKYYYLRLIVYKIKFLQIVPK